MNRADERRKKRYIASPLSAGKQYRSMNTKSENSAQQDASNDNENGKGRLRNENETAVPTPPPPPCHACTLIDRQLADTAISVTLSSSQASCHLKHC